MDCTPDTPAEFNYNVMMNCTYDDPTALDELSYKPIVCKLLKFKCFQHGGHTHDLAFIVHSNDNSHLEQSKSIGQSKLSVDLFEKLQSHFAWFSWF